GLTYAGFWIRFGAKFIDGIILQVFNYAFRFATIGFTVSSEPSQQIRWTFLNMGFSLLVGAAYAIFFVGKYGATPGKMALRLKIVTPMGAPISYGRATGRHFSEILSSIILCIGYIMAAFDDEKLALHDRIC